MPRQRKRVALKPKHCYLRQSYIIRRGPNAGTIVPARPICVERKKK